MNPASKEPKEESWDYKNGVKTGVERISCYDCVFTFSILLAQRTATQYSYVVGLICWVTIITKSFPG